PGPAKPAAGGPAASPAGAPAPGPAGSAPEPRSGASWLGAPGSRPAPERSTNPPGCPPPAAWADGGPPAGKVPLAEWPSVSTAHADGAASRAAAPTLTAPTPARGA